MTWSHRSLRGSVLGALAACIACGVTDPAIGQEIADRQYRSATGLLNRGMHELAAQEYREFLAAYPNDAKAPTARYGLGVCLSRMGLHAEASEQLRSVVLLKGFEFIEDAMLLLGQSQLLAGQPTEAAATLSRFVQDLPDAKQAESGLALWGEAEMRAGQPQRAMAAFRTLADKWPRSALRERSELLWAMCESDAGRYKEAAARLEASRARAGEGAHVHRAALLEAQCRHRIGDTDRALRLYDEVAKSGDTELAPEATLGLAQLTRATGKPEEGAALLRRLLAGPLPAGAPTAAAHIELARCELDRGDAAAALAELEKLSETPPQLNDDATYWTARALAMLGKHVEAAERLEGCESRFGESELLPQMMYERAESLSHTGEKAAADAAFASLRAKFPSSPLVADSLLSSATAAYEAGDLAKTREASEEFLAKYADHPNASTASLLIAEAAYRSGAYQEAEAAYEAFLGRYPEDPNGWHARVRRGLCLWQLGKSVDSAAVLEGCVRDETQGDPSLRLAAVVALADGAFAAEDWKRAETWYKKAAAERSEVLESSLLRLGLCVHRQGRAAEALAIYDRLLKEFPQGAHRLQTVFERGQSLLDVRRDKDAAECFTIVIEEETASTMPRFSAHAKRHLAALAMREGRAADAAALLGELEPDDGESAGAARLHLDRGVAFLAAGKHQEAERELRKASEHAGDTATGSEARANLGVALSRQGRLEESLAALDAAGGAVDALGPATREAVAYERITVLRRLHREKDALDSCRAFLTTYPQGRLTAHVLLEEAQLHAKAGRDEDVIRAATAATRAALSDTAQHEIGDHASYLLGLTHQRRGEHAEAIRALTPLLDNGRASVYRVRGALIGGEAMMRTGRYADAAALFEEVANAESSEELAGTALLRLGEARAAAGQWPASERALRDFLSRFPDSPLWFQARFGIAWAAEHESRHEAAIEEYRLVTAQHEGATAARAQFQIGECLFALKRHDDAVKELLRVDILYAYAEWSAAALYEAGRCLAEQGKTAEAREQFEQVISRFGDSRWASLAKEAASHAAPTPLPGRSDSSSTRKERSR